MKMNELNENAAAILRSMFREIPFVKSVRVRYNKRAAESDFTVTLRIDDEDATILVETTSSGQPRCARGAVNQLLRLRAESPDAYPVFLAPFISPAAADICKEAGVGYVDLAGNAYLSFGRLYVSREGKKNPFASSRRLKSIYRPVSSRVLRVLLSDPGRPWKTQLLSDEAEVSLGQVSNVKQALKDREWIDEGRDGFTLAEPAKLLAEWAENYAFENNSIRSFYSLDTTNDIERTIAETCGKLNIRYAFTCFSGAVRIAANVRYNRVDVFIESGIERLAAETALKLVDSGSNVRLIEPYDKGVFYGQNTVDGIQVASPVQVYLDVLAQKGRGEEAADFILKNIIEKKW